MDKENKSKSPLAILSHPRSLSSILFRTLMNNDQTVPLFEFFTHFYIKRGFKNMSLNQMSLEEYLKIFEEKLLQSEKEGKHLILKDHAYFIGMEFFDYFFSESKKRDFKIIYLIRHPKAAIHSLFKNMEKDTLLDDKLREETKVTPIYQLTWQMYEKLPGKVIMTEDLQLNPSKVVKEIYEYVGMDFKESYLKYEPMNKTGIPEEWTRVGKNWYEDTFSSTEIRSGVDFF